MEKIREIREISDLTKTFNDAEFNVYHKIEEKLGKYIEISYLFLLLFFVISTVVTGNLNFFLVSIIGALLLIISNYVTLLIRFRYRILKEMVEMFWPSKLYEKEKIKREAKFQLTTKKEVIKEMKTISGEWKEIAEEAEKIINSVKF